jgi:DIS3-like exonuclease 2
LKATIDGQDAVDDFLMDQCEIHSVARHCNDKRMASKAAQDRSDRVFLALYLKRSPLREALGVVLSVGEKTFTVFVPSLGVSSKLFLDEHKEKIKAEAVKDVRGQRIIRMEHKSKKKDDWKTLDIKVFTKIQVSVICKEKPPIDVKIVMEGPWVGHDVLGRPDRSIGDASLVRELSLLVD